MSSHYCLLNHRMTVLKFHSIKPFIVCQNRLLNTFKLSSTNSDQTPLKSKGKKKEGESKYSKTVLLPTTTFDQRANSLKREPEIQAFWDSNNIYNELSHSNSGEKFILHDGPPYANGDLHIGHALNKILKDFINRYQILQGRKVRYVPGWDCHGLPIELKVLQNLKATEKESLTPLKLRKRAAEFAQETMVKQREAFKRYGIWGEWNSPYLTLQKEYEAAQIRVFGQMVERGHIYRGRKPVHWSPSSRTALAEAELEYPEGHKSKSIYVGFKATHLSDKLSDSLGSNNEDVRVAIWTTTPWTIPANLAVAVNGDLEYAVVSHPSISNSAKFIVAKDLIPSFSKTVGLTEEVMNTIVVLKGSDITGTKYQHPLYSRQSEIVLGGDYITTESGTGLVHTAPGHGQEDYQTGLKYNLPLLSPVDDSGRFTSEAGERFKGLEVLSDGNIAVINALQESGTLIKEMDYQHKYPYDWRTKKPTIFRATEQWFASVSNFRVDALNAIEKVEWIPSIGKNRISSMVDSRGDWCISRQRSWGVPIPVFYHKDTQQPLMTAETISYVEKLFREKGSDVWWEYEVSELLPPSLKESSNDYIKGTDTMDVWFDSGTSWAGVMQSREELQYPADIYLEGSDQHRGWFQSSLLTSVASQGVAPYKTVLTHGFVLDEKGFKMSKSLGNVLDPKEVIEGGSNQKEKPAFGADTLRLWVSSVDYSGDVCVGENIMKQMSESYRKLRNTLRFLVGSLSDFTPERDSVPYDKLPDIDKYMLGLLSKIVSEVEAAYNNYQFNRVNQLVTQLCNIDLSSFYLDISKDRLYISSKSDLRRKSCQTVISIIMEQVAVMISPLLPHLSEDLYQNFPYKISKKSIFQFGWIDKKFPSYENEKWERIRSIRDDVNKCIEIARQNKLIGASQEAQVKLYINREDNFYNILKQLIGDKYILANPVLTNNIDDLRFLFITSQVTLVDSIEEVTSSDFSSLATETESGIAVGISKALGKKCERCWYYDLSVGDVKSESHIHSDLCQRCNDVVIKDGYQVLIDSNITN